MSMPADMRTAPARAPVLITGGAGFIGSNLAHRLLGAGRTVRILDNLSRPGVETNLRWLTSQHGGNLSTYLGDVRRPDLVRQAAGGVGEIYHLAAQVAVTTSLAEPTKDFEVNARGTLNVLEAARSQTPAPAVLVFSTNKVYGALDDIPLEARGQRYVPLDPTTATNGIAETRSLDFHSPYGCSKGAADQYALDYARSYGLRTVVLRMSCIYGPRQFGTEDQGWVAHFLIRARSGGELTIYGDGLQVRDILYVDDLIAAAMLAMEHSERLAGQAFNIGGGPENSVSLRELMDLIVRAGLPQPTLRFGATRPGDQRYYVSDTRRFGGATGWLPETGVQEGVARLGLWLEQLTGAADTRPAGPVRMAERC